MPDFGIGELLAGAGLGLGDFFGGLFGAGAAESALSGAGALGTGAAEALGPATFGGISDLAGIGIPFGAGAGELGSVATGLGPAGVTAFGDTASTLAGLGGSTLAFAPELAGLGIPVAAGAGEVGAVSGAPSVADALLGAGPLAGTGADATMAGLATSPASLSTGTATGPAPAPQPTAAGGVTAVGPTAGTPTTPLGTASFDTAPAAPQIGGTAPAAPGAVSPIGGGAAGSTTDLASTAAQGASGGKTFLDKITDSATKNFVPGAIGAAGLGYSILKGNQQPQGTQQLGALAQTAPGIGKTALDQVSGQTQLAGDLTGQGKQFTQYLPTGTLPPDQQAALDNAVKGAKTAAISNAAAKGQPTDPTKNSVLAQELAQIEQNALTTKSQMEGQLLTSGTQLIGAGNTATQTGDQLLRTGLASTGLTSDIYNKIVGIDQKQQSEISQAIANFAKALGGTQGGLNLKIA